MYLKQLKLTQFKNYSRQEVIWSPYFNCLTGRNGMGKTNMLEAVYYLCMCKSNRSLNDRQVVLEGAGFFRLEGIFLKENREEGVVAKVEPGSLKVFEKQGAVYDRLSDHIGEFPVVMIVPEDTVLISGGGEERRRFLDNTLSQISREYLQDLMQYNRVLRQRNAALKQFAERGNFQAALLDTFDHQLAPLGNRIHIARAAFIERLWPLANSSYKAIAAGQEPIALEYRSTLTKSDYLEQLRTTREKDRVLQRTNTGIHRDDLKCLVQERPARKYASQGQLKSLVLALKLAQYEFIRQQKGFPPLLLLDDIFDKLDAGRARNLLQLLSTGHFGQVFLTDTHPERVEAILKELKAEFIHWEVEEGRLTKYE